MLYFILVCVFLLFLALVATGYWISNLIMYPPLQRLYSSPEDYGLAFEDVDFKSQDGLELKGWWIPAVASGHTSSPAIILLHPMFGNRQGFTARHGSLRRLRTDVDLIKVARGFHQAGYAVLMFDFRGHGAGQAGRCAGGLT